MTRSVPILPSEITPHAWYEGRRRFLAHAGALLAITAAGAVRDAGAVPPRTYATLGPDESVTRFEEVTNYNNFYEYSTDKKSVATLAENLRPRPWRLEIRGEVEQAVSWDPDDLERRFGLEERIYRLRCVEGWSAVVPWMGVPLAKVLGAVKFTSRARFVRFVAPHDPSRFYGQRGRSLPWPYTEGLTIEEAMHPLTMLVTGMYGKPLPNQNGAPVRLVVPWKYGYKSLKSVVSIVLESERPESFWMRMSPEEYGFYGNVNPEVPHPRWSQAREVRLGEVRRRPTLPYNGYAAEVAHLYRGLDPLKHP